MKTIEYNMAELSFDPLSNRILVRKISKCSDYTDNKLGYNNRNLIKQFKMDLNTSTGFIEISGEKINIVYPGKCFFGFKIMGYDFIDLVHELEKNTVTKIWGKKYIVPCREYLSNISSKFHRKYHNVHLEIIDFDDPKKKSNKP